jgi:TetR/AcrR family transcriptional regulator
MPRPARVSPEQILDAAAREFAERGYAGARVDRIARRAAVNKAMLYYHFASKRQLYRTLLRGMFARAADRLNAVASSAAAPPAKIDRVIAELAALIQEHPVFPAIMLREVAEGGAHLDRPTLAALAAVPRAVAGIVEDGVRRGAFRPIHPVFAYFSLFAPIVFYLAGTPIRKEISSLHLIDLRALSPADFVRAMQDAARRSFARSRRARRP